MLCCFEGNEEGKRREKKGKEGKRREKKGKEGKKGKRRKKGILTDKIFEHFTDFFLFLTK